MTYDARERSADLGRPVELYTFMRGALSYRYTSANVDRTVAFNLYTSAPIERDKIEQGPEINRSGLSITVPRDFPIAQLYMISPPTDVVSLILQQYHEGDGELAVIWSGRVLGVSFMDSKAKIELEPIGTSVRRNGLRRMYQKLCPRVLYSASCGVSASTYRVSAVADVSGVTVTAGVLGTHADGYWKGGYIEWPIAGGLTERRFIFDHVGTSIELDMPPVGLVSGTLVTFYPGCDHTLGTNGCAKFSNQVNYGGMPYIPSNNPYANQVF